MRQNNNKNKKETVQSIPNSSNQKTEHNKSEEEVLQKTNEKPNDALKKWRDTA